MPTPPIPKRGSLSEKIWFRMTGLHKVVYRMSGGRIAGHHGKAPILLLDHRGRKSGQDRTTPLIYLPDDPDLVVVASYGGARDHPAWWLNLQASPVTSVLVGGETRRVRARAATPEERERLWPGVVGIYPDYQVYADRTERQIPLVVLEPA